VITTYNYGRFVGTAIESALRQRHAPLEVIVLDNASTDDTPSVVARYANDPRVRTVRNESNIGMPANHNKGLELARGAFISFLSADDFLAPDFVPHALAFYHDHPEIDVRYGGAYFMSEEGRVMRPREWPGQPLAGYAGGRNDLALLLAEGAYMCLQSMLVPRRVWERFGTFDLDLISIDWDLIVRWAFGGVRFGFDPEPVAFIRLHGAQTSGFAKHGATGREMRDYVAIFERYLDVSSPQRYRGHEAAIRRVIDNRYAFVRTTFGAAAAAEFEAGTARLRERVEAIAAANRGCPRERLAFVVLADEIGALHDTLASVTTHGDGGTRAVVVQEGGVSYAPLCRSIDAERIRHVWLPERLDLGSALNTAADIEEADIYVVLRAGARIGPNHVAAVRAALADPATQVAVCRPRFAFGTEAPAVPFAGPLDLTVVPPSAVESLAFTREAFDALRFRDVPLPEWDFIIRVTLGGAPATFGGDVDVNVRPGMRYAGLDALGAVEAVAQTYRTFPVTDAGRLSARAAFLAQLQAAHGHDLRTVDGLRACYGLTGH